MRDGEPHHDVDDLGGLGGRDELVGEGGDEAGGDTDDPVEPVEREVSEGDTGLGCEKGGEPVVLAERTGCGHDHPHEEVLEGLGPLQLVADVGEELLDGMTAHRVEQHVAAPGEDAVQGGAGDTGGRADIVHGHLVAADLVQARAGRLDDRPLGLVRGRLVLLDRDIRGDGRHGHGETVRPITSHCQPLGIPTLQVGFRSG